MDLQPVDSSLDKLKTFATDVKKFIVSNKLYVPIQGSNYVYVEGWQFMGGMLGIDAVIVALENQSSGDEIKYHCVVELTKDGKMLGRGFAICSNKEAKKKSFDEYAIASMAQTRAVGKAYRLKLGWLMKLVGYEGTPAEEMDGVFTEGVQEVEVKATDDKKAAIIAAHRAKNDNNS